MRKSSVVTDGHPLPAAQLPVSYITGQHIIAALTTLAHVLKCHILHDIEYEFVPSHTHSGVLQTRERTYLQVENEMHAAAEIMDDVFQVIVTLASHHMDAPSEDKKEAWTPHKAHTKEHLPPLDILSDQVNVFIAHHTEDVFKRQHHGTVPNLVIQHIPNNAECTKWVQAAVNYIKLIENFGEKEEADTRSNNLTNDLLCRIAKAKGLILAYVSTNQRHWAVRVLYPNPFCMDMGTDGICTTGLIAAGLQHHAGQLSDQRPS